MENTKQNAQAQLGSSGQREHLPFRVCFDNGGAAHRKNECCVPGIRLNGKWLAALDLVPGQKIRVITNGSSSIITITAAAF